MRILRVCAAVLAFLAVASTSAAQSADITKPPQSDSFFPVAVWYGGGKARAPMLERLDATSAERWGKDLDQIKSLGFNTVKCWVDWATAEPAPGEYHFEDLDLLLRLAGQRGLRVIVQLYLDSAPDWVGERFPEAKFVDRSGAVIQSQAAPGFCIDHSGVRSEVAKFLAALSKDANRSPALLGWDVWSEPHVINWAYFPYLSNPEFCYCPSSQARFRRWLQMKYPTLDALNAAWYRGFTNWDQVEAPRASTILSYTDYLDWRAFIDVKLAEDLRGRVEAIRSQDHTHPITSHAAVPGLFTSPTDGYGEPDDFKMAANADYFGTSLYPKHAASPHGWSWAMMAAGLDFTRSSGKRLGKGFWIGELQAGQGVTSMRIADPVEARDEDYWMWQVISHGAREIAIYAWYPMNAGYESNGYGLINLDGSLTERSRAAGQVAQAISRHAPEILAATPAPAQVAILYNRLSYMVGGEETSLSKLGNAERDSLEGLHRAFTEEQIPVDFVHPNEVAQNQIGQYKILFLPYPVMLSKSVAEGVERYVRGGGTAVAEARLAWNDERGFASPVIPGFDLAEVFGAKEKLIRPADAVPLSMETAASLPGLTTNAIPQGEAFEEALEPQGHARVLARFSDGEPAIVENAYGKGKAILMGSFVALHFHRRGDNATAHLLTGLARAAGVSSDVKVSGTGTKSIEIRRLVSDRGQILFAFNHATKNSAEMTLSVQMPWQVKSARTMTDDRPAIFEERDGQVVFHDVLKAGENWILYMERK